MPSRIPVFGLRLWILHVISNKFHRTQSHNDTNHNYLTTSGTIVINRSRCLFVHSLRSGVSKFRNRKNRRCNVKYQWATSSILLSWKITPHCRSKLDSMREGRVHNLTWYTFTYCIQRHGCNVSGCIIDTCFNKLPSRQIYPAGAIRWWVWGIFMMWKWIRKHLQTGYWKWNKFPIMFTLKFDRKVLTIQPILNERH